MQTYCLSCKKTYNKYWLKKSRKVMTYKVVREKLRCANCMVDQSRFLKQKFNKKNGWNNIIPNLFAC